MRGAAALAVLLLHSSQWDYPPATHSLAALPRHVLEWGELGVPLFFVISGFCIHLPLARARVTDPARAPDFRAFWLRRFRRLYPPYFAALCLSMTMVVLAYALGRSTPLIAAYSGPLSISADFVAHITMLHGFHPTFDVGGGNPVYWTLAREEYLYLLYFPLLFLGARIGLRTTTAAIAVVGVLSVLALDPVFPDAGRVVRHSAVALWVQWCLGAVAAEAYIGSVRLPRWCRLTPLAALWLALGIAIHETVLAPVVWGLAFFTLVNAAVAREAGGRWFDNAVARWFGRVGVFSYSLYLVHNLARIAVKQIIGPFAPDESWAVYWTVAAVVVVAGYVAGLMFFRVVESRFLHHAPMRTSPSVAWPSSVTTVTRPAR